MLWASGLGLGGPCSEPTKASLSLSLETGSPGPSPHHEISSFHTATSLLKRPGLPTQGPSRVSRYTLPWGEGPGASPGLAAWESRWTVVALPVPHGPASLGPTPAGTDWRGLRDKAPARRSPGPPEAAAWGCALLNHAGNHGGVFKIFPRATPGPVTVQPLSTEHRHQYFWKLPGPLRGQDTCLSPPGGHLHTRTSDSPANRSQAILFR